MRIKRFLSGVVLLGVLAIILIFGNTTIVNIAISTVAIIAINEYFNCFAEKNNIDRWIGNILAILLAFINMLTPKAIILVFLISIVLLFLKVIFTKMKTNYEDIAITGFGIMYIIGFLMFVPFIYAMDNGKYLIWYLAIAAWGTDTFAYLIGMKFGKHKFTPISPKKSIEGSIGGTIGAVVLALIYTAIVQRYVDLKLSYVFVAIVTLALSILSQLGDLSASSIKREMEIKDYGKLIPGHGGMLDRIDSIIFVAPFAYFLLTMIWYKLQFT